MSRAHRQEWTGLLYVLPAGILLALFHWFPAAYAFRLSLLDWNLIRPRAHEVGLENYRRLLDDPSFWTAVRNTLTYTLGVVPVTMTLALALAVLLNRRLKGASLYRTLLFLPVVTATSTAAVVWKWIYHPDESGLLNGFLGWFGIEPQYFLLNPELAMPAVMLMSVWQGLGYDMVILLAGLQNIPRHVVEAAEIDGASPWQRFRLVSLPLLTPSLFFVLIVSIIHSFQVAAQVIVLTGGGPLERTLVLVYYLYQQGFASFRMGYAAAIACVLLLTIVVLTLAQWKIAEKRVEYGG